MIIQEKMVKEAIFSGLAFSLESSYQLNLLKYTHKSSEGMVVRAEIAAGNCYDYIAAEISLQEAVQNKKKLIQFLGQLSILCDDDVGTAELTLSFFFKQTRVSTSNTKIKLGQGGEKRSVQLKIIDANSEPMGKMTVCWQMKGREVLPSIVLKNITCELKSNVNAPPVFRFLEVVLGGRKYKNTAINSTLYWDTPFKLFLQDVREITWALIEENSYQKIVIPPQKAEHFNLSEGFRRIFISDEFEMPKGCIQFYYQSRGLRSKEDYQRQAEIEQDNQKRILKLIVKTIKGKFKNPESNISVRMFSGINYYKTEELPQQSTEFQFTINRHLYLESRENKCNFIVYSNDDVLGFGTLHLNIIGFFERRVGIVSPFTRKEIGYLMVSIQSEKHPANSIQLAKLKLNLGDLRLDKPAYFLSFLIKGCFTRTEFQRVQGHALSFRRFILMKYTNEEDIQIALMDTNNQEVFKTNVKIELLKECNNPAFCRKVISIKPELSCTLQITCIYGDLNKININDRDAKEVIKDVEGDRLQIKPNGHRELENKPISSKEVLKKQNKLTLLDQKKRKQAEMQEEKIILSEEFQQFEQSLTNHVRAHIKGETNKSNSKLRKPSEHLNSQANSMGQGYRIMYTSKPLKNPNWNPHLLSEQKPNPRAEARIQLPQLKIKGTPRTSRPKLTFTARKDLYDSYKPLRVRNIGQFK